MADYGDVAEGIDAAGHAAPAAPVARTVEPARVRRARVPVGLIVMLLVVLAHAAERVDQTLNRMQERR